jgi:hypothetical protein
MIMTQITGLRQFGANLRRKEVQMGAALQRGLVRAGLQLQRLSQRRAPVDTGDMRNSAFTRIEDGTSGAKTVVRVGYTQSYAIYVHENLEARHKPGKTAKFLEYALRDNQKLLLSIVLAEVQSAK